MEHLNPSDLSRRALLGRIGAGVAGTAVAATGVSSVMASPASAASTSPVARASGVTQYLSIGMVQFGFIASRSEALVVNHPNVEWQYNFWGGMNTINSTSQFVHAPVNLPDGATISSVQMILNPNNTNVTVKLRRYHYPTLDDGNSDNNVGSGVDILGELTTPADNTLQKYSIPLTGAAAGQPVNNQLYNYQITDILLTSNGPTSGVILKGAIVGYTAPGGAGGGGFTSHGEPRYDSRASGGKIGDGQERQHHVSPAGAGAAVITLTATGTTGGGYLAAFSAAGAWPGNSSINWFGPGQSLATTVIVPVSPAGDIKIRCGGSPTDYLIDVVGYL